jgi:hypothetical protein
MNTLLEMDIMEACLLGLRNRRTAGKVKGEEVVRRLTASNPSYRDLSPAKAAEVIKTIFPIHLNRRRNRKVFKVSWRAAREYAEMHQLIMRPLEDARRARIGKIIEIEAEMKRTSPYGSRKDLAAWWKANRQLSWSQVLMRVDSIKRDTLQVYIPQWRSDSMIQISMKALPVSIRSEVTEHSWLFAQAHIESDLKSDLRFYDFVIARGDAIQMPDLS